MIIDPDTGVISWQPDFTDIGESTVIIEVIDPLLQSATQEFTLKVTGQNTPPNITSNPITQVGVTQTYRYDVEAKDPENNALTYRFAQRPDGMIIDAETGLVEWQPTEIGSYDVEVTVTDTQGGLSRQIYTVEVITQPINQAPIINSTPGFRADIENSYSYQIIANDPDNDTLTYQLINAPGGMTINSNTGIVTWQPNNSQLGVNSVTVAAYDPQGLGAIQSYNLAVLETNNAPLITSLPKLSSIVGGSYVYDVKAVDPDGDAIAYSLTNAPDGVTLDQLGRIRWTPQQANIGAYPVEITVTDERGLTTTQTYTLTVIGDTEAPEVSLGFNDTRIELGQALDLRVSAIDNVGVENITLVVGTTPLSLNPGVFSNAQVNNTRITLDSLGTYEVVATAVDAAGNVGTQTLQVEVVLPDKQAPVINIDESVFKDKYVLAQGGFAQAEDYNLTLSGSLDVVQGQANNVATFTGNAAISSDALGTVEGGGILEAEILAGSTIERAYLHIGTLTTDFAFRPNTITFEGQTLGLSWLENVQDMSSFTKTLNFEIGKADVTSIVANKVGNSGGIFEFNLSEDLGISQDLIVGSSLTVIYSNPNLPESTIILLEGGAIGAQPRTTNLTFANPLDLTNSQVTPQLSLGILFSDLNDSGTPQYTTVDINGDRLTSSAGDYDDGERENYALVTVGGVGDSIDNPDDPYAIRDVSDDELYNLTSFLQDGDTRLTIETRNPSNDDLLYLMALTLPASVTDIQVTNPEPFGYTYNKLLTANTDIVIAIEDENLSSYRVEYAPISLKNDPNAYTTLATGTNNVDGAIAQIDPKTLENGDYQLRVVAIDDSGNVSIDTSNFSIGGENKPGRFELEFVDLSVPLTGIPIEIYRRYDSLESDFSADFGHGWTLGIQDARIEETSAQGFDLGGVARFFDLNPMAVGDRVTLTTPDGERVGFTFEPQFVSVGAGRFLGESAYVWRPYFRPDPGVYHTLEVDYMPLNIQPDGSAGLNLFGFSYNPNTYRLITKQGITYEYDQYQGLQTVSDRNGNILTYTDNGIFSSTGQSITFNRDPQGRILEIIDPEGNSIEYSYDVNGDLVTVEDRTDAVTTFKYEDSEPHYLTEIVDPLGRSGVVAEYDSQGQISRIVDADGNDLDLDYRSDTATQTYIDALGNTWTMELNQRGNVIREVDPLGGVTERTYDANDNILTETDPLGNTTTYTYDVQGNMLTETDPLGRVTRYIYNAYGNVLTQTEPNGHTITRTYDDKGNLISITGLPVGSVSVSYDEKGNGIKEIHEGETRIYNYDSYGNLTRVVNALGHVITYTYDANGNELTQTHTMTIADGSKRDLVTKAEYDPQNRIISSTDPEGGVTRFIYDAVGNRIEEIDPLGRSTKFIYDQRNLLVETVYPDSTRNDETDNPRIKNEYDKIGRLIAELDEIGRKTKFIYDQRGQRITTIFPDNTSNNDLDNPRILTKYDLAGRIVAEVDERGYITRYVYDKAGQLVKTILPDDTPANDSDNPTILMTYDVNGRLIFETKPLGQVTEFIYDDFGRRVGQKGCSCGITISSEYSNEGHLIAQTDREGNTTRYEYDALGRMTAVVDALGQRTEYSYNEQGNLISQKDANGDITKFEYDGLGRRIANKLPEGQRSTITYDLVGNMTSTADFNGQIITFEYDERNRLIAKNFSDGSKNSFTYTSTGQRKTATDSRGTTTYNYDEQDRLIKRIDPDGKEINYTYDAAGNRTSVNIASGNTNYTYDEQNRLKTVTDADGGVTTYDYDANSNLARTEFPNGTVETRQYDELNQLIYLETTGTSGIINSFRYTLDESGNRIEVEEDDGRKVKYTYDDLYRLLKEEIFDFGGTQPTHTIEYAYDEVGNRLSRDDSEDGLTIYTYDDNDQLLTETTDGVATTYTYDNNGNTITKSTDGNTVSYDWDIENRLIAADTDGDSSVDVENQYDVDGVRVAQTVNGEETRFLIDTNHPYAEVLEEYTPDGIIKVSYVYGNELISQERNEQQSFYHVDGLGSTRALSNNIGNVTDVYIYDAFGLILSSTGNTENSYLYAGEQRDSNIGLDYLRARYLDVSPGRFVSRDPFEGYLTLPITLHRYLYAHNNPVNLVDPSGMTVAVDTMGSPIISYVRTVDFLIHTTLILLTIETIRQIPCHPEIFTTWLLRYGGKHQPNKHLPGGHQSENGEVTQGSYFMGEYELFYYGMNTGLTSVQYVPTKNAEWRKRKKFPFIVGVNVNQITGDKTPATNVMWLLRMKDCVWHAFPFEDFT